MNAPSDDSIPCRLHSWQIFSKPFAVPSDTDHHKLLSLLWYNAFCTGRSVLNKITLIEVRNLELELDLRPIVLGNLGLDFARQWALYLDEKAVLCYTIGRRPEPRIFAMAYETNFVRFTAGALIIKITHEWFEKGSVSRRRVSLELGPKNLLLHKCINRFIMVFTEGACNIACGYHVFPQL